MKIRFLLISTLVISYALSAFGQASPMPPVPTTSPAQSGDDSAIKINTLLMNIPVIASDRYGRNISGLTKDNFTITEDGEKQQIEFFADQEAPLNVAIMIDTSGSTKHILGDIKKAARDFINVLRPEDKAIIVSFDGRYKFLSELTSNHAFLESAIDRAKNIQVEDYSMYDAIYDVISEKFAHTQGRKAVILLTDGGEYGDRISRPQLMSLLSESDTVVYPIIFKTDIIIPLSETTFRGRMFKLQSGEKIAGEELYKRYLEIDRQQKLLLNLLGPVTGGKLYNSNSQDFEQAFQTIAEELKKQYLIGFYPQKTGDGKEHRIAVEVKPQDIVIRTKRLIKLKSDD